MTDEDVADLGMTEQGVIDRQHRPAGIAEDEFDSLPHQAFDQDFRAAALFAHDTNPSNCARALKERTRRGKPRRVVR
ncbi:MAG TPA: hypothetical protein PKE25_11685 [Novosphingobium sp.]|nr:hypothetical protein [Novosphingobium sp.]